MALLAGASVLAGGWLLLDRPMPGAVLAALHGGAGAERPAKREPTVTVAEAVAREVPVAFDYTGTIVSPKDAELQARVTGVVTARPFEPGSAVAAGDLLFQIDKRPFEIALKVAEAQKTQAEASLSFARAEVERARTLNKKGYETTQRTQQLLSQQTTAESSLQQAEAAIARETLNIEYSTLRAPFAGRVSLSLVNIGDTVIADKTELASVVQVDPVDLQVALSASDADAVRRAMAAGSATIGIIGDGGEPERSATIYQLDNRFDPRTARRLVRALVHNADERYLPGQFVRARVETGSVRRVLVPTVALATQLDQQIVYAVHDDGTVATVPVETGTAYGALTAITRGVEPGLRVAVDQLQRLRAGEHVVARSAPDRSARLDE